MSLDVKLVRADDIMYIWSTLTRAPGVVLTVRDASNLNKKTVP